MNGAAPRIAVSGLHRGDNPQPGASIIAAIRREWPDAFVVGLAYNAYESGIYAEDGPDVCHTLPYPSAGLTPYVKRLAEIRSQSPFEWLLPTLDAEIALLAGEEDLLAQSGIRAVLPDRKLLARCGKAGLQGTMRECGVPVPETAPARTLEDALRHAADLGYPVFVKGAYYDARLVATPESLASAGAAMLADWGPPLLIQRPVEGAEYNVLGVGDGAGGDCGHCAIRKLIVSDKGKGVGSVIVNDARLDELTGRILAHTRWLGPYELEFVRDVRDDAYRLIEINPRFPAWVGFPAQLGANFPAAWLRYLVTGVWQRPPALAPGGFFLRHQIEVCGRLDQIARLLSPGSNPLPPLP